MRLIAHGETAGKRNRARRVARPRRRLRFATPRKCAREPEVRVRIRFVRRQCLPEALLGLVQIEAVQRRAAFEELFEGHQILRSRCRALPPILSAHENRIRQRGESALELRCVARKADDELPRRP